MKKSEINRALRELEQMCRQEHCYEGYFHTYTTNGLHLTFDVLYEPGTLKAVGYRNGEPVMTETVETVGKATVLKAEAVEETVRPMEIVQIELSVEDEQQRFVNDFNESVTVEIEGAAQLIDMDSGDMTDLTMWNEKKRAMFSGRLLCALQPEKVGAVTAHFTTQAGLKADCTIYSHIGNNQEGLI